jgi:hypothetical protein
VSRAPWARPLTAAQLARELEAVLEELTPTLLDVLDPDDPDTAHGAAELLRSLERRGLELRERRPPLPGQDEL